MRDKQNKIDYDTAYREAHRKEINEYGKKWYKLNHDRRLSQIKAYDRVHTAVKKEYHKGYFQLNQAEINERHKQYYVLNKTKIKAHRDLRKDIVKGNRLKKVYGITLEQFNQMLTEQGNKCPICEHILVTDRPGAYAVDHDHVTGKIRQILCAKCNTGLGLFNEDVTRLQKAEAYIQRHK